MEYKKQFAKALVNSLHAGLSLEEIMALIETPKQDEFGDAAFPCFTLAKQYKKAPAQIAKDIASELKGSFFKKVEAVGPYVNIFYNRSVVSNHILKTILAEKEKYGQHHFGQEKTVVIDYSSPNIAKPFSMGHLRSTMIGNALKHIAEKCGYEVVGINYIGDWGTQFGKLITAYKKWGNKDLVKEDPIRELFQLYVQFHEEVKENPELEEEGRIWFKKLEDNDEEAVFLWNWFRHESLKEFSRIYELLGVEFENFQGEAFYNDKMDEFVEMLEEKGILEESDGAQVVNLDEENMPPCLIRKSDGATLYATRDLTAALYRQNTYGFDKALYVVGAEQSLHFAQFFTVLKQLGYTWVEGMQHVPFGLILKDGKKMSTRKGKVVLLEEVLEEAIALAQQHIEEKNPSLKQKAEVAKQVGVGAIIFHDLKNERMHNIEFSLEKMLKFEGETGPYVQYTHARACSILRKEHVEFETATFALNDDYSWNTLKLLNQFPQVIETAFTKNEPSHITKYILDVAQAFNKYYGNVRILEDDHEKESRLALVYAVTIVLKEGLRLLGIGAPEEM
ncbi:arginine--tRNA ligase [Bacillus cytotoxicus]|uniref:Arginine--tRNA ligase n=1 Tax=Bacillus cytotoxicus (strain DSM 22905 / CIP 110041 / 391-98 / NVH 391-98) TaxID=315749 RepID=A7GP71_BACCN|nr:arginine--tRNA ligase [Bacillus cytotoxicus]ABS21929.1 arginyl-tRNA synthetase [Bacillus cytotoxicus NVH 391-98]AWC32562.1 arginine--tRNA ligase [Bacillus cytotoxicus]AWC36590.1 arginine--tRNA ligase [Bacillus cytotoxicus]AWC44618.1 arginine--tRNA ligase [Bacillus cytotoxicus]AWC60844.1 arginine--tRNA ligase [Bacillus cytotoxicus]